MLVICYVYLMNIFQWLTGRRPQHQFIHRFFNEAGDTYLRRYVAYTLPVICFVTIVSISIMSTILYAGVGKWSISNLMNNKNVVADVYENINLNTKVTTVDQKIDILPNNLSIIDSSIDNVDILKSIDLVRLKKTIKSNTISVVDMLKDSGVKNPTVDFRAEIARELGVVNDSLSYNGSFKQNIALIKSIQNIPDIGIVKNN